MKETTPAAMPPCFERWCQRFDNVFTHKAQKREFRNYLGGLLRESERKNLLQMAENALGVTYHRLHHFLTEAPWSSSQVNERRLEIMNKCSQTRITRGFSLIIDDYVHRKSGNFRDGVGRKYIGEIGNTDNGIVVVTTHLYDGSKSLPLDIELYHQGDDSLPKGKQEPLFEKKHELGIKLIDLTLSRGYQPGIVIIDGAYGNNTSFLLKIENRNLKYLGELAGNRKVLTSDQEDSPQIIRLDELAQSLPQEAFTEIQLQLDKPKTLWVVTQEVEILGLTGKRNIAIVINGSTVSQATDINYFITNVSSSVITPQWIVNTYSQRNWVGVLYREAKG